MRGNKLWIRIVKEQGKGTKGNKIKKEVGN